MVTARMPNINRTFDIRKKPPQPKPEASPVAAPGARAETPGPVCSPTLEAPIVKAPRFKPRPVTRAPRDGEKRELRLVGNTGTLTRRPYFFGITNDNRLAEMRAELEKQLDGWRKVFVDDVVRIIDVPVK